MAETNPWVWNGAEELTVTVKTGGGYSDSWLVFRGGPDNIKNSLIQTFGLDAECYEKTTFEVVRVAESVAQSGKTNSSYKSTPKSNKPDPVEQSIEDATSMEDITSVWTKYSTYLEADSALMDKFKAKGKELKG